MTAQIKEIVLYKGKRCGMATEPLFSYLKYKKEINFAFKSTACWRGYIGTWEVRGDKLFLIGLIGWLECSKKVDLNYLFPDKNEVFANWFTDDIRITQGKLLKYIHMGYQSIFEKDLILSFKKGVLTDHKIIDNR